MAESNDSEWAYIALGANLPSAEGNSPRQTLEVAIEALKPLGRELRASSLWDTTPVDCPPDSPQYVNAIVAITPYADTPVSFLHELQAIEARFGRSRSGTLNESRVLDLDLIAWGEREHRDNELTLPHPRAWQRAFVLAPLAELAPDLILPGQDETVELLLAELMEQGDPGISLLSGGAQDKV